MKKTIFIISLLVISLNVVAQEKINTKDLIGYWVPNQNTSQMFFWKDANDVLQVQEIDSKTIDAFDTESFKVYDDHVSIKTIFKETNWAAESTYTFIDKKTMRCVTINENGASIIIYTKIK